LIKSRAIFNFTTDYFYRNPTISSVTDFSLSSSDFKSFLNYLKISDTVFQTTQELLFLDAYNSSEKTTFIAREFQQLKKKLLQEKIADISRSEDYLSEIIKDEILIRYYYKNGSYLNKLKKDTVILEAVKILKNKSTYAKILKGV